MVAPLLERAIIMRYHQSSAEAKLDAQEQGEPG
jgi:hypothetical protein